MNGKVLKVMQYDLQFGATDRFVNVFGCFKAKGNLYVIYADVDTKYPIIYYGSAHVRGNVLLSMSCRDKSEEEIIKEYIFKVINHEELTNFEMISLEEVTGLEIIAFEKIEVKPEIITSLVNIIFPKKEEIKEEKTTPVKTKKKVSAKLLLIILILVIALIAGYYVLTSKSNDTIAKKITCEKNYQQKDVDAEVNEINTYNFNVKDTLESIDTTTTFQFTEEGYQNFIIKGLYYKYMPDDNKDGGYKQDDEKYTFKFMMKEIVDTSYNKPTSYEEVFSYYTKEGYTCKEEIAKE